MKEYVKIKSLLGKQAIMMMLLVCHLSVFAQYDNIWILKTSGLEFSTGVPIEVHPDVTKHFGGVQRSCITTKEVNNRFQSEGLFIENKFFDTLNSKQQLPHDLVFTDLSRNVTQGSFFLPSDNPNLYYFLYALPVRNNCAFGLCDDFRTIYCYWIDVSANGGKGEVVYVDSILNEELSCHRFTACRHANGRDWWIFAHRENTNVYYRILLSNGVFQADTQIIGSNISKEDAAGGISVFSRSGEMYAANIPIGKDTNSVFGTDLFDFDRCTGKLSNHRQIITPFQQFNLGCAFSPDNRFLYINSYNFLYQYDIAEDTLLMIDSSSEFTFMKMALAPDNKIYLCHNIQQTSLSVISNPNAKGENCLFQFQGLQLNYYNNVLPNFPYYYLGALEGSACDTLKTSVKEVIAEGEVKVYPNPTKRELNVLHFIPNNEKLQFRFTDNLGRLTGTTIVNSSYMETKLDMGNLADGIYYLNIIGDKGFKYNTKVVVKN